MFSCGQAVGGGLYSGPQPQNPFPTLWVLGRMEYRIISKGEAAGGDQFCISARPTCSVAAMCGAWTILLEASLTILRLFHHMPKHTPPAI
jgi:hypothetical protein